MTDLSAVRSIVRSHAPLEVEQELEINGAYTWPVLIQYDYQPGTRKTWDCPGTPPCAQIRAIRDKVSGKDIRGVLPGELVKALENDLAEGI